MGYDTPEFPARIKMKYLLMVVLVAPQSAHLFLLGSTWVLNLIIDLHKGSESQ